MEKLKAQYSYSLLSHELQLLYQVCDIESKGELDITSISYLLTKLSAGTPCSTVVNGTSFSNDDAYKIMERIDKSCAGKLTWGSFKEELEQWIKYSNTETLIIDKLDYGIHLSPQERVALHRIFGAYFMRFRCDVAQFVCANQLEMTYLEDSLGKITVEGVFSSYTPGEKEGKLQETLSLLASFNSILQVPSANARR